MASDASDSDVDDDPVTAEYDVFITPSPDTHQLYVLQYPNRDRDETFKRRQFPNNMRIKPRAGFMELDVPVHFSNFDKAKGVRWGEALKSAQEDGVTSFGIAGGFAPNMKAAKDRQGPAQRQRGERTNGDVAMDTDEEEPSSSRKDELVANFEDSVKKGLVLNHQTLGGQVVGQESEKPIYMLGAFKGDQLHLTPVSGVVQMRPQFHHIDAQTRLDQLAKKKATAGPGDTGQADVQAIFERQAGADAPDHEPNNLKTLQAARAERWTRLIYHHEDVSC